jgi:sulfite exporter TauE/SafE
MGDIGFIAGLFMGGAASLHCVGMCGGIASALLLAPAGGLGRLSHMGLLHVGRILAYAGLGAAVGFAGPGLYGHLDVSAGHAVLRWAAAATMLWIGCSVLGLVPPLSVLDRWARPMTRLVGVWQRHVPAAGWAGAVLSGMLWGLMPCAMVYAALFTAMLAGGAVSGALVMLGFGLGTSTAVSLAALSVSGLRQRAQSRITRLVFGLAIAGIAPCTLLATPMQLGLLCTWR